MELSVQQFARLKAEVEKLKRATAKGAGVREELLRRLRDDFGCTSLVEAEILIRDYRKQLKKLERQFSAGRRAYELKWKKG